MKSDILGESGEEIITKITSLKSDLETKKEKCVGSKETLREFKNVKDGYTNRYNAFQKMMKDTKEKMKAMEENIDGDLTTIEKMSKSLTTITI